MHRARRPIAAVLALVSFSAVAVAARGREHTATPALLMPGSSDLTTRHLRSDEAVGYRTLSRAAPDSAERVVALGRSEVHPTEYNGKPALLLVTRSRPAQGTRMFVDTALVMRDGLAPVWEAAHSSNWNRRWEYSAATVRLTILSPDSAPVTREHRFEVPVFNFNELDVLVRSIPLREGYEAILPLYSEGSDALEMDTVRVTSRDSAGIWSVRFADPVIVATYGIDGATRRIVRYEAGRQSGPARGRREYDR